MKFPASRLLLLLVLLAAAAGCDRSPAARRQKYYEAGQRHFASQEYRRALIEFSNAVQADPDFAEGHYQLARCYMKMGALESAFVELLRTTTLQPDHVRAHQDIAGLLFTGRRFDDALNQADWVLQREPRNVEVMLVKANSQAGLGQSAAALATMQEVVALESSARTYGALALLQANAGDAAAAEASFRKAIELDPKSADHLMLLARFYQRLKRYPEAEQQYARAVVLEPANISARIALVRLYEEQGRRDRAQHLLAQFRSAFITDPSRARLLADFYISTGQFDRAESEFAALVHRYPQHLALRKSYVETLLLRGRVDEADRLNREILKDNRNDAEALIFEGQILNRRGQFEKAADALEKLLRSEPDNAVARYHLGVSYASRGDFTRAEDQWREAARLRPSLGEAQEALAGVALRRGDFDLLLRSGQQLVTAYPESSRGYLLRAMGYVVTGRENLAEADLQRAMELDPGSAVPYARLGGLRLTQKRYPGAEQLFEQALQRNPAFQEALQGLVAVYTQQKQLGKALDRVKAQLQKVPSSSPYYLMLGTLYAANQELNEAVAALQKAMQLDPNNVDAALLLASFQSGRGQRQQALAVYEQTIANNPKDVRAYVMLGSLYRHNNDLQKAEELYRKALQVQPDYPLAANNLAFLLLEQGRDLDVAASLAQVARGALPESPSVADTLGWAYYHKGAYSLAIDLFLEALKKAPDNPLYHYHLGLAYQGAREPQKARQHLERSLQLGPNTSFAARARDALGQLPPA